MICQYLVDHVCDLILTGFVVLIQREVPHLPSSYRISSSTCTAVYLSSLLLIAAVCNEIRQVNQKRII